MWRAGRKFYLQYVGCSHGKNAILTGLDKSVGINELVGEPYITKEKYVLYENGCI